MKAVFAGADKRLVRGKEYQIDVGNRGAQLFVVVYKPEPYIGTLTTYYPNFVEILREWNLEPDPEQIDIPESEIDFLRGFLDGAAATTRMNPAELAAVKDKVGFWNALFNHANDPSQRS
jgi:hypothetical protein